MSHFINAIWVFGIKNSDVCINVLLVVVQIHVALYTSFTKAFKNRLMNQLIIQAAISFQFLRI